jgi:hypothetical protein
VYQIFVLSPPAICLSFFFFSNNHKQQQTTTIYTHYSQFTMSNIFNALKRYRPSGGGGGSDIVGTISKVLLGVGAASAVLMNSLWTGQFLFSCSCVFMRYVYVSLCYSSLLIFCCVNV